MNAPARIPGTALPEVDALALALARMLARQHHAAAAPSRPKDLPDEPRRQHHA